MSDLGFSKVRTLKMTKSCSAVLGSAGYSGKIRAVIALKVRIYRGLVPFTSCHISSVLRRTLIIELSQNPQILEYLS
jgi:hypothetical protein